MKRSSQIIFLVILLNLQYAKAAEKPIPNESANGVNGLWWGGTLYSQAFSTTAKAVVNGTSTEIKSKSSIQSLGLTAQYMQMPYDSFGSYFSGTVATSLNSNYSSVLTLSVQLNLAYAKQYVDKTPYYFYGGLGYETFSGKDIVNLVEPGGLTLQAGVGMIIYKNYSFEGMFQVTQHKVASAYTDQLSAYLISQGATTVSFDNSETMTNVVGARLTYKF